MAMNLTLSNKNPFSTFDFLGYLFPGALGLIMFYVLSDGLKHPNIEGLHEFAIVKSIIEGNVIIGSVFFVIFSYVAGHLFSYVSSVTVELFYTWCYGYPTDYLFSDNQDAPKSHPIIPDWISIRHIIWRLLICLSIYPVLLAHCLFEKTLKIERFITKPLTQEPQRVIKNKVRDYFVKMGFRQDLFQQDKMPEENIECHRFVMHYVYEHCKEHIVKFDNYVALYGFLRSLTFILSLSFIFKLFLFVRSNNILTSETLPQLQCIDISGWASFLVLIILISLSLLFYKYIFDEVEFSFSKKISRMWKLEDMGKWEKAKEYVRILVVEITNPLIHGLSCASVLVMLVGFFVCRNKFANEFANCLELLLLFVATYFSYLSFAKFYRRFSLENFMALVICKDVNPTKEEKAEPIKHEIKLDDQTLNIKVENTGSLKNILYNYLRK